MNEEIIKWCEEWFEIRRKNNDMWRLNQEDLTDLFLDELKNFNFSNDKIFIKERRK